MEKLKIFVCTDHDGFWLVGVASVIVAKDKRRARTLLNEALKVRGLKTSKDESFTLEELDVSVEDAFILMDGNY